jgi:hypothetical protein
MRQFIVILLAFSLLLAACRSRQGQLKPTRPTATPGSQIVGQPIPVSFSELHDNPAQYQNQLIRVSGSFIRIKPEPCRHEWGPQIRWALIADNLRLDSVGYEQILRLAPEGTQLTIDGLWRLYSGPLGCEKKPSTGFAWYLETAQIVAPNPLPIFDSLPPVVDDEGDTPPTPTPEITPTTGTETAVTPGPGTPTVAATPTRSGISTLTPTRPAGATNTPPPPGGTATPTPSRTATAAAGTATATATPTATPTMGPTPTGVAPPPPLPTVTPGSGYDPPPPPPPPPGSPTPTPPPY